MLKKNVMLQKMLVINVMEESYQHTNLFCLINSNLKIKE